MKRSSIAALIIVLLIIVAGVVWYRMSKEETGLSGKNNGSFASLSDIIATSSDTLASSSPATTSPAGTPVKTSAVSQTSQAYTDAVKAYPYRLQFSLCHGAVNTSNTGTLSVKKGSKVMLDNRDNMVRIIAFAGQTYKLPAYGYTIITAAPAGTHNVTCDGGGAAVLNVE